MNGCGVEGAANPTPERGGGLGNDVFVFSVDDDMSVVLAVVGGNVLYFSRTEEKSVLEVAVAADVFCNGLRSQGNFPRLLVTLFCDIDGV